MIQAYRPTRCLALILLALTAFTTQFSCQAPQPIDSAPSALKPAPPVNATSLYPLASHAGNISIQVGNQPAQTHHYRLDHANENGNNWRFTLEGIRDTYLQQTANGAIQTTREDEHNEGVWVTYDPPMILLPAKLAMNNPFEQRTHMVVHNLTDGSLREQGWCAYQIQLLGCKTVETLKGRREGFVLQTRRQIELQLAEVQVVSETIYVPGEGWLSEKINRVTKPMRLFEVRQTESLQLLDRQPIEEQ